MSDKNYLKQTEFYITNVCNYNCEGCDRFNNYYFTGNQIWDDYKKTYKAWSEKLDIGTIDFIGGEPTLNPDLINWLKGTRTLWPSSTFKIVTNGSRLQYTKDKIYPFAVSDTNTIFHITVHQPNAIQNMINDVSNILLNGPVKIKMPNLERANKKWKHDYNKIKDSSWPECNTYNKFNELPEYIRQECINIHGFSPDAYACINKLWILTDINNVTVMITESVQFRQPPIINDNGKFSLHDSDPLKSFDICEYRDCNQFNKGELYQCSFLGPIKDFNKQFYIDMSDKDRKLLLDYKPLTIDSTNKKVEKFVNWVNNPKPFKQCKFCPETYKYSDVCASTNKIKVDKKNAKP